MIVRISVNGDEGVVSEISMSLLRQQLNFSYDTDRYTVVNVTDNFKSTGYVYLSLRDHTLLQ